MKPITFQFNEITRREQDTKKLKTLKHVESKKSDKLVKVKILKGYVYTTHPEDYEHLKR